MGLFSTSSCWLHRWKHVGICDVTNHFLEHKKPNFISTFHNYFDFLIYSESFGFFDFDCLGEFSSKVKNTVCYRSLCILSSMIFIHFIFSFLNDVHLRSKSKSSFFLKRLTEIVVQVIGSNHRISQCVLFTNKCFFFPRLNTRCSKIDWFIVWPEAHFGTTDA